MHLPAFSRLLVSLLGVLFCNAELQVKLGKTTLYGAYSELVDGVERYAGIHFTQMLLNYRHNSISRRYSLRPASRWTTAIHADDSEDYSRCPSV